MSARASGVADRLCAAGGVVLGERVAVGAGRVRTPLTESATIGMAVGLALAGKRVLVELVEVEGVSRGGDALADAGTVATRSAGTWRAPVVVRVPLRRGDALPALPAGVRQVVAARAAAGAVEAALMGAEPVVVYDGSDGAGADEAWSSAPARLLEGDRAVLLADGFGVAAALAAAESVAADGVAVDVWDLRGEPPGACADRVRAVGRVVYVGHQGEGALAGLVRSAFWSLESPPVALAAGCDVSEVVRALRATLED